MKNTLTVSDFKYLLEVAFKNIKAREDEFSQLDAVIGDGDHGQAIVAAMEVVVKASSDSSDFKTMLDNMGIGVMLQVSGSTSTLLGAFFLGMSDVVTNAEIELDLEKVRQMFVSALSNVQNQTKAKLGDKTMMDTLIPAVDAIKMYQGTNMIGLLQTGAEAAKKGAESTKQMKANFGRARNYGERSIGYYDSGAMSWCCLFESFAQGYKELVC